MFPRTALLTSTGAGSAVDLFAVSGKPANCPDESCVAALDGLVRIWLPDISHPRDKFKLSIVNAFRVNVAPDVCMDITLRMKRRDHPEIPVDDLDGPSASAAVAVTFDALLTDKTNGLMLERVGICAALDSSQPEHAADGTLWRVGGEEKKLEALVSVPGVRLGILART